ncbi:hypothetical protein L226DRAFT_533857 [Lentinus tigrinus ALCF2SS1-7]|uniref:uncharacterized protein n=1 Tax=Lentinus tigrinus ALCF2SS1-7 TaxID=1328758 RepID=UPI001166370F|nr:hypothetical protein L226DRAFT_533857 [Lentinus tigrinus ALCF2SS1-7]
MQLSAEDTTPRTAPRASTAAHAAQRNLVGGLLPLSSPPPGAGPNCTSRAQCTSRGPITQRKATSLPSAHLPTATSGGHALDAPHSQCVIPKASQRASPAARAQSPESRVQSPEFHIPDW